MLTKKRSKHKHTHTHTHTHTHLYQEKPINQQSATLGRDEMERVKQWECQGIKCSSTVEFSNKNNYGLASYLISPLFSLLLAAETHFKM